MKKLLLILTAIALSAALFSCSDETTPSNETEPTDTEVITPETEQKAAPAETYSFTLDNGLNFKLGDSYDYAAAGLGDPIDVLEAPNCIREGNDTVYTFNGYSIMTSPDGDGGYFLASFTILSDAVAFDNGITIGSTSADVDTAFGTAYMESFGVRTYAFPGATLSVVFDGDTVGAVTLSSVRE